jgi:HEAT repeat protein
MRPDDLQALTSPDTEDRRRAIIALGRAKDPAALNALADVYRNDPDPALRELAQNTGRLAVREADRDV